ncbi:hypothetical protein SAMN04488109_4449 [Chryseolinea serpens]|uniref:Outer membrane protein beta-barrel domain-containing protein n=1 Tax=Chryseolinea serpens TaxID=947013 RepID=A0A1M5U402_9BACT|nr:hypothetical protein [Chryseolinea serpens]SHH57752.1 hypothetical protein SAMN04488109_4449 [Chryseolinea serpens]
MKKNVLIIFACIHACLLSWAQDVPVLPPLPDTTTITSPAPVVQPSHGRRSVFYARAGVSFFMAYNPTQTIMLYAPGVTVAPGIRMLQNRDAALTLSFPITLGWSRTKAFADLDLPAMVDLHIGSAAGNNQNSRIGLVVGAGVAYLYAENFNERTLHVGGLRCHAGIAFGKKNNDSRNLVLISYGESTTPSRN